MGTLAFPEENLDNLHSFLDLNLPLEPFPLNGLKEDWLGCLPSPDHSQDISENSLGTSLNHSASTHLAFDDLLFKHDPAAFLPTPLSESPPTGCQRSSSQEAKPTGRLRAQTSRSSADGSAGAAAPRPKGQRTAAAMERNRRGARKFRERQKQKFSDLTNRVDMLETELVAMKLCKLKMEADKTQVEVHAKELEKALSALQAAANPDLVEGDEEDLEAELGAHAAAKDEHEGAYLAVPDGPTVPADKQSIKGLSYTQAFAIYKGYIQALRTCLNEMEDGEASREGSQHSVGQLIRDLVIFATRMQATSPVPLWQLYHKQESCHNTSTSFVFEHQMLEKLDLSDDQKSTLAAALHRYQGAFSALAQERSAINAALVAAATPGKDGLKKAHEAMWALKCSLAKEPRYTEAFLSACLRALTPLQTAKLIVGYFPVSVWPDFTALCACIALDAGEVSVLDGPV